MQGQLRRVLVVQNQALVDMELADRLRDMGLSTLSASDADEALAAIQDHPDIGLMLSDIRLRGAMDGIELAHLIRSRWPSVRIILTSGLTSTRFSDLPPGSIFLTKPYDFDAVQNAVAYLSGRNRPVHRSGPAAVVGTRLRH